MNGTPAGYCWLWKPPIWPCISMGGCAVGGGCAGFLPNEGTNALAFALSENGRAVALKVEPCGLSLSGPAAGAGGGDGDGDSEVLVSTCVASSPPVFGAGGLGLGTGGEPERRPCVSLSASALGIGKTKCQS